VVHRRALETARAWEWAQALEEEELGMAALVLEASEKALEKETESQ
jgi:hypothetical protein